MLNISAARRRQRASAELNIAPLIDMVFILLIFFLVNTSFVKETGIDVNRPTASTAVIKDKGTIMIGIDSNNQVYMDRRQIDVRAVRANVARALAENPEGGVVVVPDRTSDAGVVIAVMDGCREAGAENVSLAAKITSQ